MGSLADRIVQLIDHHGMSQAQLAAEVGFSPATISAYLKGNYQHAGELVPALQAWIARKSQGSASGEFLEIKASARVFEACTFARDKRRIALVVGRPGLGKTIALQEFHRREAVDGRELLYHSCSPAIKQHSLAKLLARRLELSERGTTHDLLEAVVTKMRRRPVPLVFDEANHLNVPCLEALRYVYDQVSVPMVLCGSIQLRRTLSESSDRYLELEQLQSRIGLRVILEPMGLGEVKVFLTARLGEVSIEVAKEFYRGTKGVARDLVNAIENVRELMAINKTSSPTVQLITAAFERQLLAA